MIDLRYNGAGEFMAMRPKQADSEFVVGEVYAMEERKERSAASHNHYFAAIKEAWLNLPEDRHEEFPTDEHFRKWLLIQEGFRRVRFLVCASIDEARRVMAFARMMDEYAVVTAAGTVLRVWTAMSQSMAAMGREKFEESKQKVLARAALEIGVAPETLAEEAGKAA